MTITLPCAPEVGAPQEAQMAGVSIATMMGETSSTSKGMTTPTTPPPVGMVNLGQHILAEFYDCDPNILNNRELIEQIMTDAAIKCGATVVEKVFHMFNPFGVSGVVIIAESHLAIHTWPEYGYAAVDLFTCGDSCDPKVAYNALKEGFRSGNAFFSELMRGLMDPKSQQLMHAPFALRPAYATAAAQPNGGDL